jgi:hypothetical protein
MTAAPSLAFPGSRTLAGWWRQLRPQQPLSMWVAHLFLHRVEALVSLARPCCVEPFTLLVLQALGLESASLRRAAAPPAVRETQAGELLGRLDAHFHLGRDLLRRVLHALAAEGLVQADADGLWGLTAAGEQARRAGEYPRVSQERRGFHFVEPQAPRGQAAGPPHFLNLNGHNAVPWPATESWEFDPAVLRACVDRPPEWKQRYGFPLEVRAVLGTEAPADQWERVIVDRPERLLAVLIETAAADGVPSLLGLPVRQDGWILSSAEPAFVVRTSWDELFPEVSAGSAAGQWEQAWRTWCQPRGLPADDVESCACEAHGTVVRVRAPSRLIERLRAARSDALKGEAWLLAGEGAIRRAAGVELVEAPRARPVG